MSDAEESVEVGGPELTIHDNLSRDSGGSSGTTCAAARTFPTTRLITAVRPDAIRRGLLAGQREEPAAPTDLRHRLGDQGRPGPVPDQLAEAERRDHRKIGPELDLFSFPAEIGTGLPVFHPKGAILRKVMEDYSRRRHEAAGYQFVITPHMTKAELFETTGHLGWYTDDSSRAWSRTGRSTTTSR